MNDYKDRHNQRLTGEVAAPGMFPDDSHMSNPRNVRKHAEAEREQNGAKAERAAVVKYLRELAQTQNNAGYSALMCAASDIEHGSHVK